MNSVHTTVLLNETVEGLNLRKGGVVIDGTFGGGGHSALACEKGAKVIAIDQDAGAFEKAKHKFAEAGKNCKITFHNDNFRNLDKVLTSEGVEKVDGIMLDLGLSSDQLENSGRGFSFIKDEPILMTMKENPRPEDLTAREALNSWSEKNLADVIYGYGEERYSRRIASAIVDARQKGDIQTTKELVDIISKAVPSLYRRGRLHFATRTFQALRIAVNDELGALSEGLAKGFEALAPNGRMAVISFHSLEDRVVKKFFKEKADEKKGILINKKPIIAGETEMKENPRARSAKLRIIQKA